MVKLLRRLAPTNNMRPAFLRNLGRCQKRAQPEVRFASHERTSSARTASRDGEYIERVRIAPLKRLRH